MFKNILHCRTVKPLVLHRSTRMQCGQTIVSVAQFTATNDKNANLQTVSRLVQNASSQGAKMVFLPEACDYISRNKDELIALSEPLDGPLMTAYKTLARSFNVWLSIGGFHQKLEGNRVCNSHVLINHEGTILGQYRKIHLFDVSIPDKNIHLKESDAITAGSSILPPCSTPAGNVGLLICYDLRFPEQSTILRSEGADILTFPSAFTRETGQVHWEPLLKARAIENQCYVVAAAQYGEHNESRISFGQSMIIDPMGKVIAECPKYSAECPTNESIAVATIDLELVANARKNMPVFSHRRNDIYSLNTIRTKEDIKDDRMYSFADKSIPGSTVFYKSAYCFAFTNIRCVVPGHVLVSTIRRVQRLHDMTQEEIADLFQTAVKISKIMEAAYQAASSTVCVQDGEYAGQTVPQVHVHILPRKKGDFANNDDIYSRLADQDRDTNPTSRRTLQEQVEEAAYLRTFFL
ncbi:nitrilase and fragile histidine triad fusion protein NitFhit [Dendroctonus ponderosae]|uniref:Nitrilase and fragile histidine triad fusion protein NitFhit n=1 Tax=Dendroctonus ponderosae TaxID=77166 RepID=J3JUQ9_DENPD|nr:nitrilase and fragile histidine triad fusion protein NitFhit [Dendroctonus ponderosae]AEE61936.1 unknown [Dendroctonus ponderosae]